MLSDYFFKAFWGFFDHFNHRVSNVGKFDHIAVSLVIQYAVGCVFKALIAWLMEVYTICHDEALNWDKNLKQRWLGRIPSLILVAWPSAEQAKTDVAIHIEIGIKTNLSIACRELHFRWTNWKTVIAKHFKMV